MTNNENNILLLKKDLKFQLGAIDELDWDYFLETALKAKMIADKAKVNRPEYERSIECILRDAIEAID